MCANDDRKRYMAGDSDLFQRNLIRYLINWMLIAFQVSQLSKYQIRVEKSQAYLECRNTRDRASRCASRSPSPFTFGMSSSSYTGQWKDDFFHHILPLFPCAGPPEIEHDESTKTRTPYTAHGKQVQSRWANGRDAQEG